MEESGKIVQQKKVENSDLEDENPGSSTVQSHSTEGNTRYMVFTYFKGDINSKVDEHFSRALQQSSAPSDSNSKRKAHNIELKRDEKQSRHQWSPPAQIWSSPYHGPTLSSLPMSTASVPMPVSQYRPDSHQNLQQQPHDPWLLPSVSRQSLDTNIYHQPVPELHRMMPAAVSNRQYSPLLVPLRGERAAAESIQQQTVPKSNLTPTWTAPDPELSEMRPSVNPDIGFQHSQRRKDIYWY